MNVASLGTAWLSLSSRTSRALRTALLFEPSARRAIALGAHGLDFNAAPYAFQYQRGARRHEADSARRRA
eukprot:3988653-Pleurochrysis_carterae.AAC.1